MSSTSTRQHIILENRVSGQIPLATRWHATLKTRKSESWQARPDVAECQAQSGVRMKVRQQDGIQVECQTAGRRAVRHQLSTSGRKAEGHVPIKMACYIGRKTAGMVKGQEAIFPKTKHQFSP